MLKTCGKKIAADSLDIVAMRNTPSGKIEVRKPDIITVRDTDATEIIQGKINEKTLLCRT